MSNHTSNPPISESVIIEVLRRLHPGPGRWQPRVGVEASALAIQMPPESRQTILQEAVNVLSRCIPPTEHEGRETGLVIGYIQSGKTMSFTTVAALARDNGYRIVIVVAGISQYLLDQSRQRLIQDLDLNNRTTRRPWRHIADPSLAQSSQHIIRDNLEEWNDPNVPHQERRTVLITVMKHHKHLQELIRVLRRVDLEGVPTLIIDDEGDQAGLNTRVRQGEQSTTYRRLLELKTCIPHHSFLQYTATPQAPLLINIIDVLSPSFAEVITPGPDYVGGQAFFVAEHNHFVRIIPVGEIPTQDNQIVEPPPTLLQAIRLFFLSAAAHLLIQNDSLNRSMMVHPSRLTERHGQYLNWVRRAVEGWKAILQAPQSNPARIELVEAFRRDYADLQSTISETPTFDQLVARLLHVMRRTRVRSLNSRREANMPVNWSEDPYWILVGGQSMERGFTVEGLTVSYMPRGPGVGNADAIQQRARFFGYKRGYLGHCRVFLEQDVHDALRAYVEHEEDVRVQLLQHRDSGRPMSEWRRQFFLTRFLRPTRRDVVDIDYWQGSLADSWVYQEGPHDAQEVIESNRVVFRDFTVNLQFMEHDGLDRRATEHRNQVARNFPLSRVHEELLTRIRVQRLEDSRQFSLLLRQIQLYLHQHPDDLCTVFLMSGGYPIRRAIDNDRIKELFQGRQHDRGGMTYPGDRQVRADEGISIQIRYLNLGERDNLIAENVPHAAVWVPASVARDFVDQPQGV